MKIKVIKSSKSTYWYADKIGEIFITRGIDHNPPADMVAYYISAKNNPDGFGGWIDKVDCEVVKP